MNLKRTFCLMAMLLCLTTPFAVAEDTVSGPQSSAPAEPAAPVEAEETAQPDETPAPEPETAIVEAAAPGNVTVDFKDADIHNVLRILSLKSGVNIVAGRDVSGSVTLRLVNVPWEKALDVLLKTYGYAYDRNDNVIRVTTLDNLKSEELSTEVFALNYSQAAEVDKSVRDILSERGKMRADTRSNTLIVTDMPTTLQNIRKIITRLDQMTPQVLIQAKVIEMTLGDADKFGIKWNVKAGVGGASRPHTFPFSAVAPVNSSMLRTFLPPGRGQTQTAAAGSSSSVTTSTTNDFPINTPMAFQATFPVADKEEFNFGTLDFTQFQAVLEMIKQRSDTKVLSEPHVTTLNNREAKILVGEVIAIPTFERNSSTGRMEITGYEDRDLGIRLSVTPQVNNANEIVVDIHPEITNLLGYDALTSDIKAPRFTTREAQTRVRIKNGQTIAIGGLIKENTTDTETKFPILGDIPLLDRFFRHTDKSVTKTDLLFFMTVTILSDTVLPQGHTAAL